MRTQREIDQSAGCSETFKRNIIKRSSDEWVWTGYTNNNHNDRKDDPDAETYDYGEFSLCSYENRCMAKPPLIHRSRMAHRIVLFLEYGIPVPKEYDVFPCDGNHLNIAPRNLGIRHRKTRCEWKAENFYSEIGTQEAAE
jgi:hypothetical protein